MPTIAICIPVRDERRALPGLLTALARLRGDGFVVAIAFDGCRDGSEAIVGAAAGLHSIAVEHTILARCTAPDAGRARRAALDLGRRLVGGDGLLLTTDADTRPHADWLTASRSALASADVVCGLVTRRPGTDDPWRVPIEAYLDRLHAVCRGLDPVAGDALPSHWHEGGASIGMTAAAWDRIATTPLPATGEDRAIVRAARLAGLVVRQDPAGRVRTSARRHGRATGGLADALRVGRAEAATGREPLMEHPDDVAARARRSAVARAAFPCRDCRSLGQRLGLGTDAVAAAAAGATSADAFATALMLARGPHRTVSLSEAARLLRRHETSVRDHAA